MKRLKFEPQIVSGIGNPARILHMLEKNICCLTISKIIPHHAHMQRPERILYNDRQAFQFRWGQLLI